MGTQSLNDQSKIQEQKLEKTWIVICWRYSRFLAVSAALSAPQVRSRVQTHSRHTHHSAPVLSTSRTDIVVVFILL